MQYEGSQHTEARPQLTSRRGSTSSNGYLKRVFLFLVSDSLLIISISDMCIVLKSVFTVCSHAEELVMICRHAKPPEADNSPQAHRQRELCGNRKRGRFQREGFCAMCIDFFKPYDINHSASVQKYQRYKAENGWTQPVHPSRIPRDYLFPYKVIVVPRSVHVLGSQARAKLQVTSQKWYKGIHTPTSADFRRCIDGFHLDENVARRSVLRKPPKALTPEVCMKELPPLPIGEADGYVRPSRI
ncbi:hypothetical protein CABS01_16414 [Colletotrichum abscissum]|uniref:uncharacterized protein n=1 Tax=Colletotrichum abscissum TaxID=1671311 RepID=UPI0027D5F356|nr:uncharacterized protein CABS01_16414 [Colletotrichum abscissum]KAK1471261.1 hypothetical protein CABS01_16414 [Colletotrichum abscissum]